jgi:iron complex outermembrane receptor protein
LKAVTSKNATIGVIFAPTRLFDASADYYWIQLTNDIISASAAGGLGANYINVPTNVNGIPVGYPAYEVFPYVNAGITTTSGIDVDLRSRLAIGNVGTLTGEANYTHIIEYAYGYQGTTFDLAGTHGPQSISGDTGNPKDRATVSLTWERGPVNATLSVNYTGSFHITDPSSGYNTCLQALQGRSPPYASPIQLGVTTLPAAWYGYCSVAHFTSANLYANYALTERVSIHGSVTDLFNSAAPVDLQTYGGGGALAYNAALHQDGAVGRFFLLGATFTF